jgi:hypothetical protein
MARILRIPTKDSEIHAILHGMVIIGVVKKKGSYIGPLKMDFPRFFWEEPIIWLDHVAQYFKLQQTPEEQKVTLAAFNLEGEAN